VLGVIRCSANFQVCRLAGFPTRKQSADCEIGATAVLENCATSHVVNLNTERPFWAVRGSLSYWRTRLHNSDFSFHHGTATWTNTVHVKKYWLMSLQRVVF
jgi:hypothetical protein